MGFSEKQYTKQFTNDDVLNKELVIKMLCYEEELMRSEKGQNMYRNLYNRPYISLTNEYAFNRMVLNHFEFSSDEKSVEMYRNIFRTYFNSPTDYDKDVIESSFYMRNNKCVFYQAPKINVNDKLPNCDLYHLDGTTKTTLHDVINTEKPFEKAIVAAFSLS